MKTCLPCVLVAFISLAISTSFAQSPNPAAPAQPVSLIQLVSDGRAANNRVISVSGFLDVTPAGAFLFVSSEHAAANDVASAVRLELEPSLSEAAIMASGAWVRVIGEFDRGNPTPTEPWAGEINSISTLAE